MAKELREFKHYFAEKLKDAQYATAYLNVALTDEDPRVFLLALKNVCEAQKKVN
jgi:DNA-binding phage protein